MTQYCYLFRLTTHSHHLLFWTNQQVNDFIERGVIKRRTPDKLTIINKHKDKEAQTVRGEKKQFVIDILKIDTEGNDPLVLQGAMSILRGKKCANDYILTSVLAHYTSSPIMDPS